MENEILTTKQLLFKIAIEDNIRFSIHFNDEIELSNFRNEVKKLNLSNLIAFSDPMNVNVLLVINGNKSLNYEYFLQINRQN